MVRVVLYLIAVAALTAGLAWLADRPGDIHIDWQGYTANLSVFHAVIGLAMLLGLTLLVWSILRQIWQSPSNIGSYFLRRRSKRGMDSLSGGMIAIGAGDRALATRYAIQARKALPNEPLTHLLRAQAAQLSGDRVTSRRIFDAMLAAPDTEQLGLRGLFLEAERELETEAARQYAERAMALNPKLGWAVDALFDLQCKAADWAGALETLNIAKRHGHVEKPLADRRRAVLLTAQAQIAEDNEPERAMALAIEAQSLAADLIPAASIAGRLLAAKGNTARAASVLQKTWRKAPHPDLATAYAYARIGDSPRDRLERIQQLVKLNSHSIESPIAVASVAIDAKEWDAARHALEPLIDGRLTQRVCTLMARVEGGQHGDAGRVREWLARAVNAPRDPAWTADGIVAASWAPVSPVTGQLDAFQWRVPVESMETDDQVALANKLEELVALGARDISQPSAIATSPVTTEAVVNRNPAELRPAADADIVELSAPAVSKRAPASVVVAQPVPKSVSKGSSPPSAIDNDSQVLTGVAASMASSADRKSVPASAPVEMKQGSSLGANERPASVPTARPKAAPLSEGVLRTVRGAPASHVQQPRRGDDANIFVSPRAPDDPGPETVPAPDDVMPSMMPYPRKLKERT